MKRSRWLIMIAALFLIGSMASGGQASAAERTDFTASDTFDPLGLFGSPVGTFVDPGTVTCPGYEPTGNPLDPCPPGSRINIRGFVVQTLFASSDPLMSGVSTITINANFDADGSGPAWGTMSVDITGDEGTWDGTWQGVRVREGENLWVIPVHASLRGHGGSVDGMVLSAVDTILSYTLPVIAWFGEIEGWILDPHAH